MYVCMYVLILTVKGVYLYLLVCEGVFIAPKRLRIFQLLLILISLIVPTYIHMYVCVVFT